MDFMEGSKIAQDKVLIERFSFSVEAPAGSFISHLSGVFSYLGLFFKWIQECSVEEGMGFLEGCMYHHVIW
ncbi:hypothetical protein MRB53_020431 [Persea americana]|uniref:Uncharacterized protein n=1 Tax=Persea americana TaxID=3435 RepID=A0ACC2L100_PERAE|nr:hypothetical protein MRB53_020431 [Persea americana]